MAANRASDSCRGQGRTDARDARVIADQTRMRRDLPPIRPDDDATVQLRLLTDPAPTWLPNAPAPSTGCCRC
ncbi:transposase [Streptomyces toyocaensis]